MKKIYKDKFGRGWMFPKSELCHVCGQPDSCGDCNHKKLSEKDVKTLRGEVTFCRRAK